MHAIFFELSVLKRKEERKKEEEEEEQNQYFHVSVFPLSRGLRERLGYF